MAPDIAPAVTVARAHQPDPAPSSAQLRGQSPRPTTNSNHRQPLGMLHTRIPSLLHVERIRRLLSVGGLGRRACGTMVAVDPLEELISALEDAGLWSDLADQHRRAAMRAVLSGEDVTWTAGGAWRADGEDLAEGGVEAWLDGMARALHDCGVELRLATVTGPYEERSAGYTVAVNDTPLYLYKYAAGEHQLPATEDPWMDCSIHSAAEVNRLLKTARSSRRLAIFWPGGNDGLSILGEESVLRRAGERGLISGLWDCVIP